MIYIYFLLSSFTAIASNKDCENKVLNAALVHASLDNLLNQISFVDHEISEVRKLILKRGRANSSSFESELDLIEQSSHQNFEKLSEVNETMLKEKDSLKSEIESLQERLSQLKSRIYSNEEVLPQKIEASSEVLLDQVGSFDEVKEMKPYLVSNMGTKQIPVMFTDKVLRDLLSKRLSSKVRTILLNAIKNGVVPPTGQRGIKILKTLEKITFVEVKTIGGEAGEFRIYGCLESGQVVLHFLGSEMNGSGDPQRLVLKKLCR